MRERNPFVFLNFVFVLLGLYDYDCGYGCGGAYVYMWDMGARRVHNMKNVLICFLLLRCAVVLCLFVLQEEGFTCVLLGDWI